MAGTMPAVSSDGTTIVAAAPPGHSPALAVWRDRAARHAVDGPVSGAGCTSGRIYYGSGPDAAGAVALRSMAVDGKGDREEVAQPSSARAVSLGAICDSPDGSWICYSEQGDDGFSRVFVLPTAGGAATPVSGRRDTYPLGWSADSRALYLIDGNALQGDPTVLVSVTPADGLRRTLVEGVGL